MRQGRLVAKDAVRHFATQLRALGLDPVPLARRAGILGPAELRAPPFIPAEALRRFCEAGALESGDPHLGLHAAARLERGAAGVVEFGARFAPTLGDSARFLARHHPLLRGVSALALAPAGRALRLALAPPEGLVRSWPIEEYELVRLARILRQAAGAEWAPAGAAMAHPPPERPAELADALGVARVSFGAGASALWIGAPARANPSADPPLFAFLSAQAERALEAIGVEAVPGFVRERAARQLEAGGTLRLDLLARGLHMSPRTLQRRLEASGTTFHRLADTVRCEAATRHLDASEAPLGAIAARLGYGSVRAFLRAFRRWSGMTPAQWRRRGDVLGRPDARGAPAPA